MSRYRSESFQEGSESDGEIRIFKQLQKRGLNINFSFDDHWILLDERLDGVKATKPDYYWHPPCEYLSYLDGDEVHPTRNDDLIDDALRRLKIRFDRFLYHAPLPNYRRDEIVDAIEKVLLGLGYTPFKG